MTFPNAHALLYVAILLDDNISNLKKFSLDIAVYVFLWCDRDRNPILSKETRSLVIATTLLHVTLICIKLAKVTIQFYRNVLLANISVEVEE